MRLNPPRYREVKTSGRNLAALLLGMLGGYLAVAALVLVAIRHLRDDSGISNAKGPSPLYAAMVGHAVAASATLALCLVVRRRAWSSLRFTRAILLASIIIGLISTDRILDLIYPGPLSSTTIFELHPRRGWAHVPGSVDRDGNTPAGDADVQLDRHCLRVEIGSEPRDLSRSTRVLFLGDSITFGYYQRAGDAYGAVAIERLEDRYSKINLIELNAGVTGFDSAQEQGLLVHEGLSLNPHLVVLGFCLNDVTNRFDAARGADPDRHPEFLIASHPAHWSGWVRAIRWWMRVLRYGPDEQRAARQIEHFRFTELLAEPPSDQVKSAWQMTLDDLDRMSTACRERGIPFVIVAFPILTQLGPGSAGDRPQRELAAFSRARRIPLLDLLPIFRSSDGAQEDGSSRLMVEEVHPNTLGHRVAGEALAEFLERNGILDSIVTKP
ncbi:MAG TPA: SGNH/GDSL hydrolase family protein [Phycisphaerae bacterium]|nr:SGNH/GDSL hydrolase family protein [Phycisphaerae bacterium]